MGYLLYDDGTYTNYSPLSTSLIVCGNYEEDYALGIEINKNITISFRNSGIKYKHCRFAIVYITDEAQLSYETNDISINGVSTTHIVSDVSYLSTISLDDIFIKNNFQITIRIDFYFFYNQFAYQI